MILTAYCKTQNFFQFLFTKDFYISYLAFIIEFKKNKKFRSKHLKKQTESHADTVFIESGNVDQTQALS